MRQYKKHFFNYKWKRGNMEYEDFIKEKNLIVNSNLQIAMIFTVISIIRSYIVRRMFNGK